MLCRDTTKFSHGGELCVSMYMNSRLMKAKKFSGYCVAVQAASKSAGLKWSWPRNRAIKCRQSQNWSTIPNIMFALSLKNLMNADLKHWNQSLVRVDRRNSPKMIRLSSRRRPNARRTFWAVRSNAGRWKNCVNIWWQKRLLARSASKLFALFCMRKKSGSDVQKPGKNAMIRGLRPKKTNPQICKQARIQWSDDIFRRVWPSGDTSSAGPSLLPHKPSDTFACHLSSASRCSALAGILRCASEEAVGLCTQEKASPGSIECFETASQLLSGRSADSFDTGQFFTASQVEGIAVLPEAQHSYDLDADQCFMAESYRMSVYTCEGICYSRNQLSKS